MRENRDRGEKPHRPVHKKSRSGLRDFYGDRGSQNRYVDSADRLDELFEAVRIGVSHVGQGLAIHGHARFRKAMDELRVGNTVHAGGGVDPHDPEGAHFPLFLATGNEGMLPGLEDGLGCSFLEAMPRSAKAFGLLEDFVAAILVNLSVRCSHDS